MKRNLESVRKRPEKDDQWDDDSLPNANEQDIDISDDRLQVEEFSRLLLEKDMKKTKILVNDDDNAERIESRHAQSLNSLREQSRQKYLGIREEQQLHILHSRLNNEDIFDQHALTDAEIMRIRSEKRILSIAEQRKNAKYIPQTYQMPEGIKVFFFIFELKIIRKQVSSRRSSPDFRASK